jgi:hypothetical protein
VLAASTRGVLPDGAAVGKSPGRYDLEVRITLVAIGGLLVLSGLVWIAQGLNLPFAPRSFMTSDRSWILIGAVAIVGGGLLIGRARR